MGAGTGSHSRPFRRILRPHSLYSQRCGADRWPSRADSRRVQRTRRHVGVGNCARVRLLVTVGAHLDLVPQVHRELALQLPNKPCRCGEGKGFRGLVACHHCTWVRCARASGEPGALPTLDRAARGAAHATAVIQSRLHTPWLPAAAQTTSQAHHLQQVPHLQQCCAPAPPRGWGCWGWSLRQGEGSPAGWEAVQMRGGNASLLAMRGVAKCLQCIKTAAARMSFRARS